MTRHDSAYHGRELEEAMLLEILACFMDASVAPKSTVLARICLMPPPDPIDW